MSATIIPEDATPSMRQYWELKQSVPDAFLFFRMGDFYELFGDDATRASQILDLTLTSRDRSKPNPVPMAGVPAHSVEGYLQKLLDSGHKVALAEQVEDKGKGLVRREIVRTLTPALRFESELQRSLYLATCIEDATQGTVAVALLDPSRGEVLQTEGLARDAFYDEVLGLPIAHWVHWEGKSTPELRERLKQIFPQALHETVSWNRFSPEQATRVLQNEYQLDALQSLFNTALSQLTAGFLVHYCTQNLKLNLLGHLKRPRPLKPPTHLRISSRAKDQLDVVPLFELICRTGSALGRRELRRWIESPLTDPVFIAQRQQAVRTLAADPVALERIQNNTRALYDLERLCGRISTRMAHPRDLIAVRSSLESHRALWDLVKSLRADPEWMRLGARLATEAESLGTVLTRLRAEIRDDAPLVAREGGIFCAGTDPELDRLITLSEQGASWLVELERRERERTGISSLKVKYNRVFGYFIEITTANLGSVPADYQRKQTTVGGERFFTEELKRFEEDWVQSGEKRKTLELRLFEEWITTLQAQFPALMQAAETLAAVDAMSSLSALARDTDWIFPVVTSGSELLFTEAKHPLVDAASKGRFVPNSVHLHAQSQDSERPQTLLITGPNMGGKSTLMRQTALLVILGQMGAPIPAQSAQWGVVSSIFTRIGAQDAIASGQSTFMVEMIELAEILHHADARSLLILDEIGRGTSTYDGISVAWSALEWIHKEIRCRTLFATHYHELTQLEHALPGLRNKHLSATEAPEGLRFLYRLADGPSEQSFGIQVAQMAGIPKPVITRAWTLLRGLETREKTRPARKALPTSPDQLPLFLT